MELGRQVGATERIDDALAIICRRAAEVMDVVRVTVWRVDDDASAIECMARHERRSGGPTVGARLLRSAYPDYFQALMNERCIAAHDARADPRTAGLSADYLLPLEIHALLDAPVRVAGRTVGIVCHEQSGAGRVWTPDEQAFAASIADLVALCLEGERSRAVEAAHSRTSELLEVAIAAAKLGAWSWDLVGDTIEWSHGVGPIYGRPEGWSPNGLSDYLGLMDAEDAALVQQTIQRTLDAGREDFQVGHRVPEEDGQFRFVEGWGRVTYGADGAPLRIVGVVSDVTERRELEAELLQSQKMEGLGRLAGGVAHDLNNLLMVMKGNVELVGSTVRGQPQATEDLEQVDGAIDRAVDLVGRLLTFARREPVSARVWSVEVLVERVEGLLRRVLGEDVRLVRSVEPGLRIEIDGRRFEQLLVNLAVNARDAMPQGGQLAIEGRRAVGPDGSPEVGIVVRDEGTGLGGKAQDRAFEPFFTTKPEGQGTGLGLSICYGIVKQARGRIGLRPVQPRGTEVWLRFPLAAQDGIEDEPALGTRSDAGPEASSAAVVLVVEDEPALRRLLVRILGGAGYRVFDAGSPEQALEMIEGKVPAPDVVLSDLVMPGMPVREFHQRLVERAAEARFVWMTGYSEDWIEGRLGDVANSKVLSKPFDSRTALEAVNEVLSERTD